MNIKKSNMILTVIISITTISLAIASLLFFNIGNSVSTTAPVVKNNSYETPGFEENEVLDENMKSNTGYKNKAKGIGGVIAEFKIIKSAQEDNTDTAENQNAQLFTLFKSDALIKSSVTETTTIQTASFMIGDVDLNGEISIADATLIQKMIAYLIEPTDESSVLADVNADNSVDIRDATLIQMYCNGLIDSFVGSKPSTEPTTQIEDTTASSETNTSDNESAYLPPKAPVQNGEWGASVKN